MRKFLEEFKKFAFKGNVVDMAVGVIIGAAFAAIVTSLVNDIISPLLGLLVKVNFSELTAKIGGVTIKYGSFIMAVINFVIVALCLFLVIRSVNRAASRINELTGNNTKPEPTTKKCPYCLSEIPIKATRCPHCTSQLPEGEKDTKI